ncbi:DNA-directed RNA polymerase subunit RPC12/RpoP [Streptomyces umbrinus]|uniref:DNA-directed RNA polymerase subunit RPC12/RpoP n=1 Tax=Streptomyces umbrinus TaxID=67370 RepID=A0ABU0T918_9ACTN|nr:hypothetical protein [Streptomyces umbrinus]MDQ1031314.1 DNA-directed RNA polymerase subunit RPC12/RpoP [Streptomyces umbrinus]
MSTHMSYPATRSVEHPGSEVHFPPIPNGLDYLISVVELLEMGDEQVSARALKYAVLHLAAGAEVLLKARLQREHWTLVFKDPGTATRSQLEEGTLKSCDPDETVRRLRDIAGVAITAEDGKALRKLAERRNALQHYGLIGPAANARAVESQATEVLDFLIRFLDEELLPHLDRPERRATRFDMTLIRAGLTQIRGFVKKRMQRLRAGLEPLRDHTVQCPDCDQMTLVVERFPDEPSNDTEDFLSPLVFPVACLFCGTAALPAEAAHAYLTVVLGRLRQGGPNPSVLKCPDCSNRSLVLDVRTAAAPDDPADFCFCCARVIPGLHRCGAGIHAFRSLERATACLSCLSLTRGHDEGNPT